MTYLFFFNLLNLPLNLGPESSLTSTKYVLHIKLNMLSIAPMIGWTDRNYRFLMRQITKETHLYTEMVLIITKLTKCFYLSVIGIGN